MTWTMMENHEFSEITVSFKHQQHSMFRMMNWTFWYHYFWMPRKMSQFRTFVGPIWTRAQAKFAKATVKKKKPFAPFFLFFIFIFIIIIIIIFCLFVWFKKRNKKKQAFLGLTRLAGGFEPGLLIRERSIVTTLLRTLLKHLIKCDLKKKKKKSHRQEYQCKCMFFEYQPIETIRWLISITEKKTSSTVI